MTALNDTLSALLPEWRTLIQGWSATGQLTAAATEALMLSGDLRAQKQLQHLVDQWAANDYRALPEIVLLSSADMNGAWGAYASSTGKIYLNADWLATASKDQVFAVLNEELGHSLDAKLNASDTSGDEGEYFAKLLSGQTLSDAEKASLRSQNDAGSVVIAGASVAVENATAPVIRGNSFYQIIYGPDWNSAQNNATAIGGYLTCITSSDENYFIGDRFNTFTSSSSNSPTFWIGATDRETEGVWKWVSGEAFSYNFFILGTNNYTGTYPTYDPVYTSEQYWLGAQSYDPNGEDYAVTWIPSAGGGYWNDVAPNHRDANSGIAELPITSSIVFTGVAKEGQNLTTTINLNAGNQTTGNLVNGATVYWSLSGITADDLTATSPNGMSGSGTIQNGQLFLTHALKIDADTGEQFKVSVFSDAALTQQIGTTASVAIQEVDTAPPTVSNIIVQGTTVILQFSEAVSATSVPLTAFKVQTVSGSTITTRTISQVALDQNDATKVILSLSGTAPASSVNLRITYTDPSGDQTSGVVQDLSGNDLASITTPLYADTFLTGSAATIASEYKTLTLTGALASNATGNAQANTITGNTANNTITGGLDADILTGLSGADTFKFALADTRLSGMDRITDLAIGTDFIDGSSSCSAANLIEFGSVVSLAAADIATVLNSSVFLANRAATFTYGSGASQRTFLALNDGTKGFQSASDGIIEITGFSGQLTNLAVI